MKTDARIHPVNSYTNARTGSVRTAAAHAQHTRLKNAGGEIAGKTMYMQGTAHYSISDGNESCNASVWRLCSTAS